MDGILEQILDELRQLKQMLSDIKAIAKIQLPTFYEKQADTLEFLPEILTAQDIANYLKISRASVYELLKLTTKQGGIPNIQVGLSKRVEKADFIKWIEVRKREKA